MHSTLQNGTGLRWQAWPIRLTERAADKRVFLNQRGWSGRGRTHETVPKMISNLECHS